MKYYLLLVNKRFYKLIKIIVDKDLVMVYNGINKVNERGNFK